MQTEVYDYALTAPLGATLPETLTLYPGDNGCHRFYEDEASNLLIINDRQAPDGWFVLHADIERPGNVTRYSAVAPGPCGPLSRVIRDMAELTGIRIAIDPSREWCLPHGSANLPGGGPGNPEKMQLREVQDDG